MDRPSFDALTRRASLMTLGASGLGAVVASSTAEAKKKKKRGDVNKRCKQQAQAWDTLIIGECGSNPDCLVLRACGEPLKTCNFTAFFACYLEAVTSM